MTTHVQQTLHSPGKAGPMQHETIDLTIGPCTRYSLQQVGPRQCGIKYSPNTSTLSWLAQGTEPLTF